MNLILAKGIGMNYLKFGSGNKTLVMIPGLSVQSVLLMGDAVKNAFRAYEKDYTAYLIDRREDVPPVYTVADMARDTAEKMKEHLPAYQSNRQCNPFHRPGTHSLQHRP